MIELTLIPVALLSSWCNGLICLPMCALMVAVVPTTAESKSSSDDRARVDMTCDSSMSCDSDDDEEDAPIWYLREGKLQRLHHSSFQTIDPVVVDDDHDDESARTTSLAEARVPGGESVNLRYVRKFLTRDEVRRLIGFCDDRDGWTSSPQNLGGTAGVKNTTRTSSSCPIVWPLLYLPRMSELKASGRLTPAVEAEILFAWDVLRRVASFLDVGEDRVEPLQLVRYEPGQFYRPHHDHGSYYGATTSEQRPVTLLLFLSDVPVDDGGGHTRFNELDVAVLPRAGDGIVWNNVATEDAPPSSGEEKHDGETPSLRKGDLLLDALHEAVPPRDEGKVVKYVMNVWISEKKIMDSIDGSAYRTK